LTPEYGDELWAQPAPLGNTPLEKFEKSGNESTIWGGVIPKRRRGREGSAAAPHATLLDLVSTKLTENLLRPIQGGN
jgi:hypothetical protein